VVLEIASAGREEVAVVDMAKMIDQELKEL
jgi:hypothetical protein